MLAPNVSVSDHRNTTMAMETPAGSDNDGLGTLAGPFLPKRLVRSAHLIWGVVMVAISLAGCLSLATWTVSDPSLTFANGGATQNWLGFWGASFADFSMQFVGFAAVAVLIPPMFWGFYRLTNRTPSEFRIRAGFWIGSIGFLSAMLGCSVIPTGWPLQVGLGGVVGDAVLSIPRAFTGEFPSGAFAVVLALVLGVPGLWCLLKACDLTSGLPAVRAEEEQDAGHFNSFADDDFSAEEETGRDWGSVLAAPVGLVMHLGYSAFAWLRNRRSTHHRKPVAADPFVTAQPALDDHGYNRDVQIEQHADVWSPHDDGLEDNWSDDAGFEIEERSVSGSVDFEDDPVPYTDAAETAPQRAAVRKKPAATRKVKAAGGKFALPSLDLLSEQKNIVEDPSLSSEALEECARQLESVLEDFGVKGQILKVRPGPVVTLYELEPAPGVKSSRVIGLAEDIARSMSAIAARVAVVPGRNAIGIELPNKRRETVYLREQLSSKEFRNTKSKLAMCLGKTIGGEPVIADLAKMPHLLVAGTTGSGKSVAINTMILSLLYRLGPEKCKLIMIDPKMLELSIYDGIPHLLTPVVVDPKKAVVALKWTVREMEERYKKMSKVGVRNIDGFNARVAEAQANGEVITRTVQTGFDRETGEAIYEHEDLDLDPLPYIVVIIDEMADLMMVAGKDIEGTVQRLAQMARAAGIHVIMATQRPSVDVITGTIKANFPTRISFQVTSKIDSRTILGEMGAEQLLGMGDMLYMAGGGRITRVHGPFVDDQEVEDVVNHLKTQGVPQYLEAVTEEDEEEAEAGAGGAANSNLGNSDDPYDQAVAIVLRDRKVSTSYIQRRLSIGYNRAASLIERMEQEGLISPANHAGKREILIPAEDETI